MVTCGLCGETFEEDRSQPACRACPLGKGCNLVRCPHCGYENPRSPGWLDALKGWLSRADEAGAPGPTTDEPGRPARPPVMTILSAEEER